MFSKMVYLQEDDDAAPVFQKYDAEGDSHAAIDEGCEEEGDRDRYAGHGALHAVELRLDLVETDGRHEDGEKAEDDGDDVDPSKELATPC